MSEAPIVIHRPAGTGGRRVTIRAQGAGLARSDDDVIEFYAAPACPTPVTCWTIHDGCNGKAAAHTTTARTSANETAGPQVG